MECFRSAARTLGFNPHIFAADCNPSMSAACHAADRSFAVPRSDSADFIPAMLELCECNKIELFIPTIDTELESLSAHAPEFAQAGTTISISLPGPVRICRDKLRTAEFLRSIGIPVPETATLKQFHANRSKWEYPIICKPRAGSSSRDISIHYSAEETIQKGNEDDFIVQRYWKGKEYTVNLFFDAQGLRCAVPHLRYETRAGEVSKGITERVPTLLNYAQRLGDAWKGTAYGALCFQAILRENGQAAIFEINARFGGGYPLAHRAGAEFARWLLELQLRGTCSAHDSWNEGVTMLRYDSSIFI